MRVRYVGQQPVSFMSLPHLGEVRPGAQFDVPDEAAVSLLLRRDIEAVPDAAPAPPAPVVKPAAAPDGDASVATSPVKPRKTPAKADPAA